MKLYIFPLVVDYIWHLLTPYMLLKLYKGVGKYLWSATLLRGSPDPSSKLALERPVDLTLGHSPTEEERNRQFQGEIRQAVGPYLAACSERLVP